MKARWWSVFGALLIGGCFGARADIRNYYVVHQEGAPAKSPRGPIQGLVQVRSIDAAAVYEKFQIVVRQSPYQLRYSDQNVWAVKPSDMVGDQLTQALTDAGSFALVTRELFESRPDYFIGGELEAIEVYDSDDLWFAHLALTLYLSRFDDGKRIWGMRFDERREVPTRTFSHAIRALSELLGLAAGQMISEIGLLEITRGNRIEVEGPILPAPPPPIDEHAPQPIYVPEKSPASDQEGVP